MIVKDVLMSVDSSILAMELADSRSIPVLDRAELMDQYLGVLRHLRVVEPVVRPGTLLLYNTLEDEEEDCETNVYDLTALPDIPPVLPCTPREAMALSGKPLADLENALPKPPCRTYAFDFWAETLGDLVLEENVCAAGEIPFLVSVVRGMTAYGMDEEEIAQNKCLFDQFVSEVQNSIQPMSEQLGAAGLTWGDFLSAQEDLYDREEQELELREQVTNNLLRWTELERCWYLGSKL